MATGFSLRLIEISLELPLRNYLTRVISSNLFDSISKTKSEGSTNPIFLITFFFAVRMVSESPPVNASELSWLSLMDNTFRVSGQCKKNFNRLLLRF